MSRPSLSNVILAVLTAVMLAATAWLVGPGAPADDEPGAVETAAPDATDAPDPAATSTPTDAPADPAPPADGPVPVPAKPPVSGSAHQVEAAGSPVIAGNAFKSAVTLSGYWPDFAFNTTTATVESGEPRFLQTGWYIQRTAWAKWKAPLSGYVSVTVEGATYATDTSLNVYTGTAINKLTRVGTNDDQYHPVSGANPTVASPDRAAKLLSLKVTAGVTYYFQIGQPTTSSSATPQMTGLSAVTLSIIPNRYLPTNDFIAGAAPLTVTWNGIAYTTAMLNGATIEEWEPTDNDEAPDPRSASVWYKFTPPQTGEMGVITCQYADTPTVAVFTNNTLSPGTGYGDLDAIAFDYDNSGNCGAGQSGGSVNVGVNRGQTYFIQISHANNATKPRTAYVGLNFSTSYPFVGSLSKTSGPKAGGSTISIYGQGFNSGTPTVKFGTKAAVVVSASEYILTVKVPKQTKAGKVAVLVTSGGVVSNPGYYTYK